MDYNNFNLGNINDLSKYNYNGTPWTTINTSTSVTGITTTPYPNTTNPYVINEDFFFVRNSSKTGHVPLEYLNNITKEYFEEFNVDIEEITLKELYDYIIKRDPELIEFIPQTVDRCILALKTEWSKNIKDKIQIPFTGELHRFYLKMKLTHGPLK